MDSAFLGVEGTVGIGVMHCDGVGFLNFLELGSEVYITSHVSS